MTGVQTCALPISFIGKADGKAMTVIRVDDEPKAAEALKKGGIALLTTDDISAR